MDAQIFANQVAAALKALGMDTVVEAYAPLDGWWSITPTSSEFHNVPVGQTQANPLGGFNTGVEASLVSPDFAQSGFTSDAWAAAYFSRAKQFVMVMKAMIPGWGEGYYDMAAGKWSKDPPGATVTPAPAPAPSMILKPGYIMTPMGPTPIPGYTEPVAVADKTGFVNALRAALKLIGISI